VLVGGAVILVLTGPRRVLHIGGAPRRVAAGEHLASIVEPETASMIANSIIASPELRRPIFRLRTT